MRVLVADDHQQLRQSVARTVGHALPAEVVQVADGGLALGCLEAAAYDFDLLILDVDMPRASGLDVLSALRSVRPDVPVVVISGDATHEQAALELGAQAFLTKPFRSAELTRVLRRVAVGPAFA